MDYETIDKAATLRAKAAIESKDSPFDIIGLCQAIQQPYPYTDDDIRSLAAICRTWDIHVNVETETWWPKN